MYFFFRTSSHLKKRNTRNSFNYIRLLLAFDLTEVHQQRHRRPTATALYKAHLNHVEARRKIITIMVRKRLNKQWSDPKHQLLRLIWLRTTSFTLFQSLCSGHLKCQLRCKSLGTKTVPCEKPTFRRRLERWRPPPEDDTCVFTNLVSFTTSIR